MKKKVIGVLISLFFLQTGCFAQTQENLLESKEETQDQFLWDFGEVNQGDIVKHIFVLKNDSEKTLNIDKVNTSCGCTASKLEKDILSPGESTEIEVKFDSKGYIGPVTQHVYVNTDSPKNPVIQLTIKAKVVKPVENPEIQN